MEGEKQIEGAKRGWRQAIGLPSLPESFHTIPFQAKMSFGKKLFAFLGPGYLVAVGYMDPGNWATDLSGGSKFGFELLSVILLSNFIAMFLQALCAKLGIVTGRDLAQACRDTYSKPVSNVLWVLCELAIAACDLAEVLGSAVALKLLFGVPILAGVVITIADVFLILLLQNKGFRLVEAIVIALVLTIGGCFTFLLWHSGLDPQGIARGFVPSTNILRNPEALYISIGILGATVMPHNLYLHSSIVQTRAVTKDIAEKKEAVKFAVFDSTTALVFALFVNAAILIVSAAAFHNSSVGEVSEIQDAFRLLAPVLGVSLAGTVFAVALLASGVNSTLTGTLAGQIVMEGFLNWRMPAWARRLVTRLVAVVPAFFVIAHFGETKVTDLLVLSQVILSFQLPFAVFPLVQITSDRTKMGEFTNKGFVKALGYTLAMAITIANFWLLYRQFTTAQ